MSKAYSQDLRERVLNFLEINNNKKAASFLFKVSITSIYRWIKQVLIPELRPGQVLILDNASFHRSETSKKLVEASVFISLFS